jgi:hypothetical protein
VKKAIFQFPDKVASWNNNLKKEVHRHGTDCLVCGKGTILEIFQLRAKEFPLMKYRIVLQYK